MGNNHNDKFHFFEAIVLLVGIIAVTILVGYLLNRYGIKTKIYPFHPFRMIPSKDLPRP